MLEFNECSGRTHERFIHENAYIKLLLILFLLFLLYMKTSKLKTQMKNKNKTKPISDYHYSELTIQRTNREHSGNYTCVPSNAQPAFVLVHIFKGELQQ